MCHATASLSAAACKVPGRTRYPCLLLGHNSEPGAARQVLSSRLQLASSSRAPPRPAAFRLHPCRRSGQHVTTHTPTRQRSNLGQPYPPARRVPHDCCRGQLQRLCQRLLASACSQLHPAVALRPFTRYFRRASGPQGFAVWPQAGWRPGGPKASCCWERPACAAAFPWAALQRRSRAHGRSSWLQSLGNPSGNPC